MRPPRLKRSVQADSLHFAVNVATCRGLLSRTAVVHHLLHHLAHLLMHVGHHGVHPLHVLLHQASPFCRILRRMDTLHRGFHVCHHGATTVLTSRSACSSMPRRMCHAGRVCSCRGSECGRRKQAGSQQNRNCLLHSKTSHAVIVCLRGSGNAEPIVGNVLDPTQAIHR